MRPRSIVITTLLLSCINISFLFGQASEEEISKEFYRADGNINLILNNLPEGWAFKEDKENFIIYRKDSVFVLIENRINTPIENKEIRISRIKEHGVKTLAEIIIRYENKWDFLKIQEAQLKNAATIGEISKLPEKYNITSLLDPKLSRKNLPVYTAKNEKEKLNIADYYKEKGYLEKKLIRIPDYNSQLYSLFNVSTSGKEDDSHLVFPVEASIELYTILTLFREACGK